jgi:hypothetical protein
MPLDLAGIQQGFEDPANAELAAKAHRRPSATTSFAFPK